MSLLLLAGATAAVGQEESSRFHAQFADGTYLERVELRDWHDANATPRVGSHPLFAPENPVEWIVRDRLQPVHEPKAFVEFVGGDRLPGVVRGVGSVGSATLHHLPHHLVVEPISAYRRPNSERTLPIRVKMIHVRRIVWRNRGSNVPAPPSTAIRRDGSRIAFRALRWSGDSLAFLTDSEIVTVPLQDLAQVSFPKTNSWNAYFDHAATLLPDGTGRLIQIETNSGLVALVSTQRLRPETQGDNRYTQHWYQIIQPAWSLDPLWVQFPDIRLWRFFPPERVPLTLITPRIVRDKPAFSKGIVPKTNRTSGGMNLADAKTYFGWGFSTHAPSELIFPLPAQVMAVESQFGLDPKVGRGGCAETRIELHNDDQTSVLFESEPMIGSSPARSTDRLLISPDPGATLHLITDPLVREHPSHADPFDIRDALNWYAPILELDAEAVRDEIRKRAPGQIAPLADWERLRSSHPPESVRVKTNWSTLDWEKPRFRTWVLTETSSLGVRRELQLADDARYLAVLVQAPESAAGASARIQVKVQGTPITELAVPTVMGQREPDPLLFPIDKFAGNTVTIELFQIPTHNSDEEPAGVEWLGISVVSERPESRNPHHGNTE